MVTRIGTKQRKTRHKFKGAMRQQGKIPLSEYFQSFEEGDKVNLKIHPNVQKGRFFPRFHGFSGIDRCLVRLMLKSFRSCCRCCFFIF